MQTYDKNNRDVVAELLPQKNFEQRFSFVEDDTLRKNIAIVLEYIIFLVGIVEETNQKELIRSSLYKDMFVCLGTIIEACLFYVLMEHVRMNAVKKSNVFGVEWKIQKEGLIFQETKKKRIRYVIEQVRDVEMRKDFVEINRACLRGGILSRKEFEMAESIRDARNKIHVSGLKDIENTYSKSDLDHFFGKANRLIDAVEHKLEKMNRSSK